MNDDLPPAAQLRAAARLVERVLIALDMTSTRCGQCGAVSYHNWEHKKLYDRLTDLPTRLGEMAKILETAPDRRVRMGAKR